MLLAIVFGTRPEIIKLAPVIEGLRNEGIEHYIIHTGQHYDYLLSDVFIKELGIPEPNKNIGIGSGTQAEQVAKAIVKLEKEFEKIEPSIVIVQGDTNTTLAAALAAVKLEVPVAHVEAGLRSFDWSMPEEINRILVDHCSCLLFAPSKIAAENLLVEGIPKQRIFVTGNTIVDSLKKNLHLIKDSVLRDFGLEKKGYALLTLHRKENVDNPQRLKKLVGNILKLKDRILFPIHPRTKKRLKQLELLDKLAEKVEIIEPLGYIEFLSLLKNAKYVLTDSGGVQEESFILGVPCITLRYNTERPETVEAKANFLVGDNEHLLIESVKIAKGTRVKYNGVYGYGDAGRKIVGILKEKCLKGLKIPISDQIKYRYPKIFLKNVKCLEKNKIDEDMEILGIFKDNKLEFSEEIPEDSWIVFRKKCYDS